MNIRVLFLSFLLATSSILVAQTSKYDIVLFGKSIGLGQATASKSANGNQNYKLITKASATVLFKERTSSTDIVLEYKGNVLQQCKLKREKDGEWQDIQIVLEGGKHYFIEDGKKMAIGKPVTFTSTQLFFKEPVGVKEVYIERLNTFAAVEKQEDGLYKTVTDGGDNYYRYENGVMVEFRVKKGVNIYMNKM